MGNSQKILYIGKLSRLRYRFKMVDYPGYYGTYTNIIYYKFRV